MRDQLQVDAKGYLVTQPGRPETSIDGVYAAGDVADAEWRQGITAAGSGCQAALAAERWLTSSRSMRAIWRDFSSPKSFLYFPAWRRFALRHWGPVWGWAVFVLPYARWAAISVLRTAAPSLARALARRSEREQAG